MAAASGELTAGVAPRVTRWEALHRRCAGWFLRACQVSSICLVAWVLALVVDFWVFPNSLDALMNATQPALQVVYALTLAVLVAVPLVVPLISMLFLGLSLAVGYELSGRELRWSVFAVLICALGLAMFVVTEACPSGTENIGTCRNQVSLFVADQFNHGSFGDVFDVFDISWSSMEFDSLSGWSKFFALNFRMLCAVTVISWLMRWLGGPIQALSNARPVQLAHQWASRAYLWAAYGSVACLVVWAAVLALESAYFPGYFERLDTADDGLSQVLRPVLFVVLAAIPAVVPLVSLVYLVLSLLVGHVMRGRAFLLTSFVLFLCAAGLWFFIEGSACKGTPQAMALCSDQVFGYVADQFYKGAFADIFDVYELKLGEVDSDSLSVADKLMVLNFRMLCAVYVVGVFVALRRWRTGRKSPPDAWAPTVFADTLPMRP